eukprot:COSAG02_NODE_35827_length_462_cov_2.865014_1_plen_125_part_01
MVALVVCLPVYCVVFENVEMHFGGRAGAFCMRGRRDWLNPPLASWALRADASGERRDATPHWSDGHGGVEFEITSSTDGAIRAWILRLHLDVGQRVVAATVDGKNVEPASLRHLEPIEAWDTAPI